MHKNGYIVLFRDMNATLGFVENLQNRLRNGIHNF